jgi:hypothetical protein
MMHPSHLKNAQGTQCERCNVIQGEAASKVSCPYGTVIDSVCLTCGCSRDVAFLAVNMILDAVTLELDRVVMHRDEWVELRQRISRLRPSGDSR